MNKTTIALVMTALLATLGMSAMNVQAAPAAPAEPTLHEWTTQAVDCTEFCDNCFLAALLTCFVLEGGTISGYKCGPDPVIKTACTCTFTCSITSFDRFVTRPA